MFAWFLPKEFNFFELFEKQVAKAAEAARCFREMVSTGAINEASLQKIRTIEHQADDVAHLIIDQLNKTFITPFDREDIPLQPAGWQVYCTDPAACPRPRRRSHVAGDVDEQQV